jgi:hypothetical protein
MSDRCCCVTPNVPVAECARAIALIDYEYVRRGTANVFCNVAPKNGHHLTHATADRTARYLEDRVRIVSQLRKSFLLFRLFFSVSFLVIFGPLTGQ